MPYMANTNKQALCLRQGIQVFAFDLTLEVIYPSLNIDASVQWGVCVFLIAFLT